MLRSTRFELEPQRGDHARLRNRDGRLGRQRRPDDSSPAFLFRCQGSIALGMYFIGAGRDALGQEQAPIADDLGCTMAQLALAWCTKNPHVSTVITGASRASQVRENLAALEVADRIDDEVKARIEEAVPFRG